MRYFSIVREISGGVQGELNIASADTQHSGSYTCTANNDFGQDIFTVRLIVQGKFSLSYCFYRKKLYKSFTIVVIKHYYVMNQ